DHLVGPDPVEDPREPRIPCIGQLIVAGRHIESMRRIARAPDFLRWAGPMAPDPAALAGRAVMEFAGSRTPRLIAAFALAHFDEPRLLRMLTRDPVEPVRAEVHAASAAREILLVGIEHLRRRVLGVRRRDHDGVTAQERGAFG